MVGDSFLLTGGVTVLGVEVVERGAAVGGAVTAEVVGAALVTRSTTCGAGVVGVSGDTAISVSRGLSRSSSGDSAAITRTAAAGTRKRFFLYHERLGRALSLPPRTSAVAPAGLAHPGTASGGYHLPSEASHQPEPCGVLLIVRSQTVEMASRQ